MRQIGTVSSETDAMRLADFLLARGIHTQVDSGNGVWVLWAFDEDRIDEAKRDMAEYVAHPNDPRYNDAHDAANQFREEMNRQLRTRGQVVNLRNRWERPKGMYNTVTVLLIAISAIVFVLTMTGQENAGRLLQKLTITRYEIVGHELHFTNLAEVRSGEVWRLFTPMFIHFTLMHLGFNMMMLYSLGSAIEFRQGSLRFACLVLLVAGISNYAQFLYHDPRFGGMSGVDYGLFGYLWMKSRYEPEMGFYLQPKDVFIMLGWLVLCMTGFVGNIANAAHVVGMATGMVLGIAPVLWRRVVRG